jgi:hypothetical protein
MNYQHIMNLAVKRRATLIKRLHAAQAKFDDVKCDQIMMILQGENEIIGDCRRQIERTQRELAILLCKHNREVA